jgi:predicted O-methyltransferase YrrM
MQWTDRDWRLLYEETFRFTDSAFMNELMAKREETASRGSMGRLNAAALYALARVFKPQIVLETGSYRGMSTAVLRKAQVDVNIEDANVITIDNCPGQGLGLLVPAELKAGVHQLVGDVRSLVSSGSIPPRIDLFLHDSTHRYQYQRWEFETFWPRLRSGAPLISHDVDMNASFLDFVSRTYVHDDRGKTDRSLTSHVVWGRISRLGFVVKA